MLLKLFILFSTANKLDHGFLFLAKHPHCQFHIEGLVFLTTKAMRAIYY